MVFDVLKNYALKLCLNLNLNSYVIFSYILLLIAIMFGKG